MNLDDFADKPIIDKKDVKTRKESKLKRFKIRYDLTKEKLVNQRGGVVSNAILEKAMGFIENDHLKLDRVETLDDGVTRNWWTCRGSVNTVYTLYYDVIKGSDTVTVGCNCFRGVQLNLECSHLIALLIATGMIERPRRVVGGVRVKPRRINS